MVPKYFLYFLEKTFPITLFSLPKLFFSYFLFSSLCLLNTLFCIFFNSPFLLFFFCLSILLLFPFSVHSIFIYSFNLYSFVSILHPFWFFDFFYPSFVFLGILLTTSTRNWVGVRDPYANSRHSKDQRDHHHLVLSAAA